MNRRPKSEFKQDFEDWELRQKHDGYLLWFAVIISIFPIINFLMSPSAGSRLMVIVFLGGLGFACMRLLNSAAMASKARIRLPAQITRNAGNEHLN